MVVGLNLTCLSSRTLISNLNSVEQTVVTLKRAQGRESSPQFAVSSVKVRRWPYVAWITGSMH